ncbi:MAG: glycosyltransferase family 4 protein [Planctomycetota bacterium]
MIAVDATPLALGPRRGVARALRTLIQGLAALSLPVPVRLFSPRPLDEDVPALSGVVTPPTPAGSARAFRRILPRLLEDAGATVLYSPWSAFPRTPVPVVATVHELPFVRLGPIEGWFRTRNHRRWLRRNVRACAAVVVPTHATREDVIRATRCPPELVHRIPNGFDPAPWRAAAASRRPLAPPYVAMVGTGTLPWGPHKKGLDVLLAAGLEPDLADIRMAVVGEVDRPLPAFAHLHSDVDDAALHLLVASARVVVHPARSEGFGYPVLEAMAAGVPVVASRIAALEEVGADAALFVPPEDPVALATALRRATDDESLRASLIGAGRRRADAFSPPESAQRLLDLLLRVRSAS